MTRAVPVARERGILRRGFFTSPAVNVMLFQASEENREPTCETQKATNKPKAPAVAATDGTKEKSGLIGSTPRGVQKSVKFALIASAWRPRSNPIRMSAMRESVLA